MAHFQLLVRNETTWKMILEGRVKAKSSWPIPQVIIFIPFRLFLTIIIFIIAILQLIFDQNMTHNNHNIIQKDRSC